MELGDFQNGNKFIKVQRALSEPFELQKLILGLQTSIFDKNSYDYLQDRHLRYLKSNNFNSFKNIIKRDPLAFSRKHLLYKMIRIQKELQFVMKNMAMYQKLTPREKEILQLLANGNDNPRIATQLFISRYTVEQHRKNINRKLKIKSFVELIKYSYAFDLV